MATISIDGDKRILKITGNLRTFLNNPKKAMRETGDYLLDEFDEQFKSEGSRLTSKWQKLDEATIAQRLRLGYGAGPILERTGKLREGFEKQVKRLSVRVHNPVSYYEYHQLGTDKIPQRKMIAAPDKVKQEIVQILRTNLDKTLKS